MDFWLKEIGREVRNDSSMSMSGLGSGRSRTYLGSVGGMLGPPISALALTPGPHSHGQGRVDAA